MLAVGRAEYLKSDAHFNHKHTTQDLGHDPAELLAKQQENVKALQGRQDELNQVR